MRGWCFPGEDFWRRTAAASPNSSPGVRLHSHDQLQHLSKETVLKVSQFVFQHPHLWFMWQWLDSLTASNRVRLQNLYIDLEEILNLMNMWLLVFGNLNSQLTSLKRPRSALDPEKLVKSFITVTMLCHCPLLRIEGFLEIRLKLLRSIIMEIKGKREANRNGKGTWFTVSSSTKSLSLHRTYKFNGWQTATNVWLKFHQLAWICSDLRVWMTMKKHEETCACLTTADYLTDGTLC